MRTWNHKAEDPLALTLAADTRLTQTSYVNDQIWELLLGKGDPPALAVATTYGLRARSVRIFPRFSEGATHALHPADFELPPHIRRYYPNFIELFFSPLPGIEVVAEYWAAESQAIAGRFTITNHKDKVRQIELALSSVLVPLEGQSMGAVKLHSVNVLAGSTSGLNPVLFMTGGPHIGEGPYPSLNLVLDIEPHKSRQITWVQAALATAEESFTLARQTAAKQWDAERTRIELLYASQTIQFFTGDTRWDAALAHSQKNALALLQSTPELPYASFVGARNPDHGASHTQTGKEYTHFWSGQTPLETYYLASLIPGALEISKGLLLNFIQNQSENGEIDCKPGLAGQRGKFLAAPILASLALKIYQNSQDQAFLAKTFPALKKFFWAWFSPAHDRDRNGLPEWTHALQTGYEDNPLFNGWHAWAQGVEISTVQTPALAAMLHREAACLIEIAKLLNKTHEIPLFSAQAEKLLTGVSACWQSETSMYHYVDRDTHISLPGKVISQRQVMPDFSLSKSFDTPVRLLIRLQLGAGTTPKPGITITGQLNGEIQSETITGRDFRWNPDGAVATSRKVYSELGDFQIEGLSRKDRILIQSANLNVVDHTLLTPLWAKIPKPKMAKAIVQKYLLNPFQFHRPFGIPACPTITDDQAESTCLRVHLPWNQLIGEGMLAYGYREEAAALVSHLMSAIIHNLQRMDSFYQYYHAETGEGLGERNALTGLAPVGLFMQTLGVQIVSPTEVHLEGENPFPWAVRIQYKGLTIERGIAETTIIFPNQQQITIRDKKRCILKMD